MKRRWMVAVAFSLLSVGNAGADQTINDDLIVQKNECIGFDCANGETFSDTIKLKENNTRLRFIDSADTSGNGWQITANDSTNGGSSYMAVTRSNSDVSGVNGLRIDAGTAGGVALGEGATTTNGTVSVGSTGNERRLVHVAEGINDSDVLTVGQMMNYDLVGNYAAQLINQETYLEDLEDRLDGSAATAAALSALSPNARANGRNHLGIGFGSYQNTVALAVGYFYLLSENSMINVAISKGNDMDGLVSRLGFTYQF